MEQNALETPVLTFHGGFLKDGPSQKSKKLLCTVGSDRLLRRTHFSLNFCRLCRKMTKIYQKTPKSTSFEVLRLRACRIIAHVQLENSEGAPQARSTSVALRTSSCNRGQTLASYAKALRSLADTAWRRTSPEHATARPNRHCHALWAPFGGK